MILKGNQLRTLIFAALAAVVSAAGPGEALAQKTVRIGLAVPNYGPYAPVYAAVDLGYYKQYGVKAEITAYRGGGAAQQSLVAGGADIINFFPPGMALAVKKGVKEKIVGPGMQRPFGWHIMVSAKSAIRSLKDLDGKKVGITAKGSTTDFFALWAAAKGNVRIQTIPVGGAGLMPGLKSGNIDAVVLFPPLTFKLMLSGEGRSLIDFGKEMEPVLPDVWVAKQSLIDGDPKAVEGVLRAIYRATAYMKANRNYSLKYLKNFTKQKDNRVVKLDYEVGIMNRSTSAIIKLEWLRASLALATSAGIKDLPRIHEIYTDRFKHVRAE